MMEAAASPDEVGLRAMVSVDVLLFAHDALRQQAEQPARQGVLARLKELRRRHKVVRDLTLFAPAVVH